MPSFATASFIVLSGSLLASAQYTATYDINNLPNHTENDQSGTNQCGTVNSQDSQCQTMVVNSLEDFCLWGPPEPNSAIGATEQIQVAWCTKEGRGTRTIPAGALSGVHFVQTPDYVQITGVGNLSGMNINADGGGGELDPHGADGNGNPHGGLVFSDAFGPTQQIHEWTKHANLDRMPGNTATTFMTCMGCEWNMPADYSDGVFESCQGDSDQPMGRYDPDGTGHGWASTFSQGQPTTPDASPAAPSSQCNTASGLDLGAAAPTAAASSASTSTTSLSTTSKINSTLLSSTSTGNSTVAITSSISSTVSSSISATATTLSRVSSSLTSASVGAARAANAATASTAPTAHASTGGASALRRSSAGLIACFLAFVLA